MTAERVFSLCGTMAAIGWLMLIIGARLRWVASVATGVVLPMLLAVLYTCLIVTHWTARTGGFGSLAQVRALFSNDWLLLAGWIHYLAFDLFIGSWEVRDAQKQRIPYLAVVPCLVLTFLLGPAGLMLYFAIRWIKGAAAIPFDRPA